MHVTNTAAQRERERETDKRVCVCVRSLRDTHRERERKRCKPKRAKMPLAITMFVVSNIALCRETGRSGVREGVVCDDKSTI